MKRVTIRIFNYNDAKDNLEYSIAISNPQNWFFAITNKAITYYSIPYKSKAGAMSAAKWKRKYLKALGKI
jgi:hypothetical protein